jgi:hypothetical protein
LSDLVIPDLARWEDWESMDKLVRLFKDADEESSWVRVPVINFLRACPRPEAKAHLEELAKLDPESMQRANSFFPLGGGVPAAADANRKSKEGVNKEKGDASEATADPSADDIPDASKYVDPKERAEAEMLKPGAEAQKPSPATASRVGAAAALLTPKRSERAVSTGGIAAALGLALAGLFAAMIIVLRGGQHTTWS